MALIQHRSIGQALLSLLCGLFHSKRAAVTWRNLENVSATLLVLKNCTNLTSTFLSLKHNLNLHFATNNVSGVFTQTTPESVKK